MGLRGVLKHFFEACDYLADSAIWGEFGWVSEARSYNVAKRKKILSAHKTLRELFAINSYNLSKKSQQHLVFPGGHPSKY